MSKQDATTIEVNYLYLVIFVYYEKELNYKIEVYYFTKGQTKVEIMKIVKLHKVVRSFSTSKVKVEFLNFPSSLKIVQDR